MESVDTASGSDERLSSQSSPQSSTHRAALDGILRRNSSEQSHGQKLRKLEDLCRSTDAQMVDVRARLSAIENTLVEVVQATAAQGRVAVGDAENGFQMLPMTGSDDERRRAVCCSCWTACLDMFC
jgi:hypothetical protein